MNQHLQRLPSLALRTSPSLPCAIEVQDVWGPQVHGCGSDFDFTLLFQEVVLSISPLVIGICWAVLRIWKLMRRNAVVAAPVLRILKLVGYVFLVLLQTVSLVVNATTKAALTRATIATSCLNIIGILSLLVVSQLEHGRSVRASTLLLLYLGFSVLADAMRARTLWSMSGASTMAALLITSCAGKLVLLVIERRPKTLQPGARQPTPDERADIFSRSFLWWLVPLFKLGRETPTLTSESLPDIELKLTLPGDFSPDADGNVSEAKEIDPSGSDLSKPSIFLHLLSVRRWLLLSCLPPRLCYTGFLFAQPFLVQRAIEWLTGPADANTYKVGGGIVAAYVIVYVGIAASQAFYRHSTARAITAIRADLVIKIHTHTLKLSSSSSSKDSASTLMSSDVERFATGSRNMNECWACLIEIALALWLLEKQLGVATATTGGLTLVFVGLTGAVVGAAGRRQNAWLKSVEDRIAATTHALKAMKGVKMTGAVPTVRNYLAHLRKTEVVKMRRFRYILLVVLWAMWVPVIMAPIIGFTLYNVVIGPGSGHVLDPALVYRCLTIFALYGNAVAILLQSLLDVVTAGAALLRIQAFLLGDNTRQDKRLLLPSRGGPPDEDVADVLPLIPAPSPLFPDTPVRLQRLSRTLGDTEAALQLTRACAGWTADAPLIIRDANLEVSAPTVVAVVGPTGSGKTTLLQLLLGETHATSGSVAISTRRIGYCSQTPWLTHDTIKNNIVGSEPFDEEWYNTVIRATALEQDISTMATGDSTSVGNAGSGLSGGQKKRIALARAIYSRAPVLILDDPFNGLDGRTETAVLAALLGPRGLLRRHETLVIWATSAVHQVRLADRVISLTDMGDIRKRDSLLMPSVRTDISSQVNEKGSSNDDESGDFDSRPLPTIEVVQGVVLGATSADDDTHAPAKDPAAYRYYIGGGGKRKFLIFLGIISIFVVGNMVSQIWVVRWAENNVLDPENLQQYYIGLYFTIGAVQLIAWTSAALFFIIIIAEKAAERCHGDLLDTVLSAPMSFFDSTAAGKTINRFSQDMQLIDTELPYNLMGTVTQFLVAIGQCAVIIYGSPWSGIAVPFVGLAVYWLQRAYLPTSRQLRLLELEAKGPLFSHFLETLNGLATIRALRWTAAYSRKNQAAVTTSQKPFYLLFQAQNWLNLVLDLITAGLAVAIITVGVATRSQANSMFGLALFSAAGLGATAKNLIQHWTQLEISMGAIERVRAFTNETLSEEHWQQPTSSRRKGGSGADSDANSKAWHGNGSITFQHASARYTPSSPLVLRDVSFTIQPGQRYAICGRTGSGKSTLIATLLRLIPLDTGTILIDDTDISTLSTSQVRSRFITLPQEPVLIGGTVRHNMHLYNPTTDDASLIAALSAFGLWETILAKGGLDAPLAAGEEVLSHGQKQLFCFARSTLQEGNIVILDEPSSQSDRETGAMMERTIEETFRGRTVLCVAHKLSTVLEFDGVVVMDAGAVVEMGSPRALLDDRGSVFSGLMGSQRGQVEDGLE